MVILVITPSLAADFVQRLMFFISQKPYVRASMKFQLNIEFITVITIFPESQGKKNCPALECFFNNIGGKQQATPLCNFLVRFFGFLAPLLSADSMFIFAQQSPAALPSLCCGNFIRRSLPAAY